MSKSTTARGRRKAVRLSAGPPSRGFRL